MQLRDYQAAAVNNTYAYLRQETGNPCVVIPTAGGKTPIIATIAHDVTVRWGGRCMILAHVKELLEQAVDKLASVAPDLPVGVYSAGMNRRDTEHNVIVAQIQSVFRHAAEIGKIDILLVDEAHLIKPDEEGRYRTFIVGLKEINPALRVIGFTATPFRTGSGYIYGDDRLFQDVCYEVFVKDLVVRGYISKVITKTPEMDIDMANVRIRAGEFDAQQVAELYNRKGNVSSFVVDAVKKSKDRHSILVFCSSIDQAKMTAQMIEKQTGEEVGIITKDTSKFDRKTFIARFKGEQVKDENLFHEDEPKQLEPLRWLVNVDVLTTGFDAPNVDCVCLFRPTASPVLYVQMVGRGFRLFPGKENCLILDYGGNIRRFGPIDAIEPEKKVNGKTKAPVKTCPECECVIAAGDTRCPECGHEFKRNERGVAILDDESESMGILSGEIYRITYDVLSVDYEAHEKRNAQPGYPKTLQINYHCKSGSKDIVIKEWKCPEHQHVWLRQQFEEWWKDRTKEPPPKADADTPAYRVADKCAFLASNMGLAEPKQIVVEKQSGKLDKVVEYIDLGKPTEPVEYYNIQTNDYGEEVIHCFKCNECAHARFQRLDDNECYCCYSYRLGNVDGVNACMQFVQPEYSADVPF